MRPLWIKAALALAAIWLVAGSIILWARSATPSPASIAKYLDGDPLAGRAPEERRKVIDHVATQLNRLEYEERRVTRMEKRPDQFFKNLTPEEQAHFVERTMPEGFKQMVNAINKMPPDKRIRFVVKAIEGMRKQREEGGEAPPKMDDPGVQKIMSFGLKSFDTDAAPETKMALIPLIEEMQRNLTGW